MAAYQCPFDPNIIFYTKDNLVLHCKQNHVLCKLCDTMSVNQASLEEHYRRRHPKSPPPKVQPAATSSPNPADEPESEQVEPSQEDQAKTQPQPQPDQLTPAIQANVHPVHPLFKIPKSQVSAQHKISPTALGINCSKSKCDTTGEGP